MTQDLKKHSYTIPCASAFRDAVTDLAVRRRVNVGDLARSVLLVVPQSVIRDVSDPGEPGPDDRETVILKSGTAKGRPWRRKPRLQVRMAPGFEVEFMRRALAIALALDQGETRVLLTPADETATAPPAAGREVVDPEELVRLRTIVSVLSFDPLADGVRSREDALYVLGFPPGRIPDGETLRARFRMLAT
ncbi:MAG: molecular chaperone DnaJ, partial [Rhodospirillales bacterium CG15_BIG_FIL_POST_REV_8_21_14_020_66_15]